MKPLVVGEHTRISRGDPIAGAAGASLSPRVYERLRRFDQEGRREGEQVFDWRHDHARTTQWVGVVQVPGAQVEILPKIDAAEDAAGWGEEAQVSARKNLLYMLQISGDVPVRSRDVARLATRRAPLSETLVAIFAGRLREELLRGPERDYVPREENLRSFKGKLLIASQTRANAGHRERFYCQFDEFSDDTRMNRIFKATCKRLLAVTWTPGTQDILKQCLLLLDDATDCVVQDSDFDGITITRQNQRFEELVRFCRLVLADRSPTIEAGQNRSFSLLFDMNRVFERFIATLLRRFVAPRIGDIQVHPQAAHRRRHLLECDGRGVLNLAPDVLIEGFDRRLVMDTKWKLLAPGKRGRGGVADGDLYQLHAYTRRFDCRSSVLLYPRMPSLQARDFHLLDGAGDRSGDRIAIRHVRLHRNLYLQAERAALVAELEAIVREGLGLPPASPTPEDGAAA